ncbi:hypothetical protein HYT02_05215 [Candidatus Gottesmanbacteria bacterium]|nr:hypothetical protein [Candidatus Gottesmanbacteria bacterium]
MEISYPSELITTLKGKYLLLDSNLFIDSISKPTVFKEFLNGLKEADITLTTLELIKFELLKGSANLNKYAEKENLIGNIIDVLLPIVPQTSILVFELIKKYGIDGTGLTITDLFLGAMLIQYKKNMYLMTRDTTDFIQRIFDLAFVINIPHGKGIYTYGIYQYSK